MRLSGRAFRASGAVAATIVVLVGCSTSSDERCADGACDGSGATKGGGCVDGRSCDDTSKHGSDASAPDSSKPGSDADVADSGDSDAASQHDASGTDGGGDASTDPPLTGWPDATNTGVPAGTTLTDYTGPCTITTAGTTIDAKRIKCDLVIRAANVTIKRSSIVGSVSTDENSTGYSFTISDSSVDVGQRPGTGVGAVNFTAIRVHVTGGNRSMNCWHDCVIRDSYVHGQFRDATGTYHESGIRMGQNATIQHNSILCDAPDVPPDAGCSADLTGYGDFGPVRNNLIDNNRFMATTGGACAYGGSSGGKPYSSQAANIRFTNNTFERGPGGKCGYYFPITDFSTSAPGNVWTNNKWDDGKTLLP